MPTLPPGCVTGDDIQVVKLSYINQDFQKTSGLDFELQLALLERAEDLGNRTERHVCEQVRPYQRRPAVPRRGQLQRNEFRLSERRLDREREVRLDAREPPLTRDSAPHRAARERRGRPGSADGGAAASIRWISSTTTRFAGGRSGVTAAVLNATDAMDPIRQGDLARRRASSTTSGAGFIASGSAGASRARRRPPGGFGPAPAEGATFGGERVQGRRRGRPAVRRQRGPARPRRGAGRPARPRRGAERGAHPGRRRGAPAGPVWPR